MKKSFQLFLMLLLVVASMSSCMNNDSDDSNLYTPTTSEIRARYNAALSGSYGGRVFYFDADSVNKTDSTGIINWDITTADSTVLIYDFPISVLSNYLAANKQTEAAALVKALPDMDLVMNYYIPSTSYTEYLKNNIYAVGVAPANMKIGFGYNGKQYILTFASQFSNGSVSYGSYGFAINNQYQQYIIFDSISIDGTSYTINRPFLLLSR